MRIWKVKVEEEEEEEWRRRGVEGRGVLGDGVGGVEVHPFIKVVHVCITGTLLQTGFMIQGRACWKQEYVRVTD